MMKEIGLRDQVALLSTEKKSEFYKLSPNTTGEMQEKKRKILQQ